MEMYGHFSGINRKVQLKYQVCATYHCTVLNRTVLQPKGRPRSTSSEEEVRGDPSLLLVLKWGGELTPTGRVQAEELGKVFRCMYPGGQGESPLSAALSSLAFMPANLYILSVLNLPHLLFESFWPFSDLLIGGVPASEVPLDRNSRATSLPNGRPPIHSGNTTVCLNLQMLA